MTSTITVSKLHSSLPVRAHFRRISLAADPEAPDRVTLTLDEVKATIRPLTFLVEGKFIIDPQDRDLLSLPLRRLMDAIGNPICTRFYLLQQRIIDDTMRTGERFGIAEHLDMFRGQRVLDVLRYYYGEGG